MKVANMASIIREILLLGKEVDFCGMDIVFLLDAFMGSLVASFKWSCEDIGHS